LREDTSSEGRRSPLSGPPGARAGQRMDEEEDGAGAEESGQPRSFMQPNDLSRAGGRPEPGSAEKDPGSADSEAEGLPYPALAPVVFFYLSQDSRPRSWCLRTVCNPYPSWGGRARRTGIGGLQGGRAAPLEET
jgi:hypothetical protein